MPYAAPALAAFLAPRRDALTAHLQALPAVRDLLSAASPPSAWASG